MEYVSAHWVLCHPFAIDEVDRYAIGHFYGLAGMASLDRCQAFLAKQGKVGLEIARDNLAEDAADGA